MFESHKLSEKGFQEMHDLKAGISAAVNKALELMPECREKSIFKTKVEEAVFFGAKAVAQKDGNFTELVSYPGK
jgi:hypothetical protein